MTYDEMIAVIQAAKEGKQLEYWDGEEWKDVLKPDFNFGWWKYRVKPEPRKPRTLYAVYSPKFNTFTVYSIDNIECARDWQKNSTETEIVEFVEVIKENQE